jgi:hypothetical protein
VGSDPFDQRRISFKPNDKRVCPGFFHRHFPGPIVVPLPELQARVRPVFSLVIFVLAKRQTGLSRFACLLADARIFAGC